MTPLEMRPQDDLTDAQLEILERVWANEATPEERAQIDAWFAAHPSAKVRYDQMHRALRTDTWVPLTSSEKTKQVASVLQAITPTKPAPKSHTLWSFSRAKFVRIAVGTAAVALACLAIGVTVESRRMQSVLTTHVTTYQTRNGERATVVLPDGSRVILNVGSRLEVPTSFAIQDRTVRLSGEASFEVTSQEKAPFIVQSGSTATRVLGTKFLVRNYSEDSVTTVAVQSGRVSVDGAESHIVNAGQQLLIGATSNGTIQPLVEDRFSFERGVLTLSSMPLARAIIELNRWYDVEIHLSDPTLGAIPMRGQFAAGSPAELIEYLQWTFRGQVVREGRRLTLYPRT
jgi:transmembrane sensor